MKTKTKQHSRKDKYKEEASLVFDSSKTHVEPYTTLFQRKPVTNVVVAASAKEIYIGNYKIKWENVLSLKVFTSSADSEGGYDNGVSVDDVVNDETNGNFDGDDWYLEDCSLEVRCRENKQEKGDLFVSDEDYTGPVRVFDVRQPVDVGRNSLARWQDFRRTLQEFHRKELKKRQKKLEREMEEQQKKKTLTKKQQTYSRNGPRYGATFASKKKEKWIARNATNMKYNKDLTGYEEEEEEDDDDVGGDFVARAIAKKGKDNTKQEVMNRLEEQERLDSVFNNNAAPESVDIDEAKQTDISNQEHDDGELEWNDNVTNLSNSEETEVLVDSSNEDDTNETGRVAFKKNSMFRSRRKKLKAKALVDDDDDDDEDESDDDVFGSQQTFTTPSSQRVVSPGTTAGRKRKVIQDSDDDDDEDRDEDEKGTSRPGTAARSESGRGAVAEREVDKNIPKITSFFKKDVGSKPAGGISKGNPLKNTSNAKPRTPKRKEQELTQRSSDSVESDGSDTETIGTAKPNKSSDKASIFFQPRKAIKKAASFHASATKKASSVAEAGETPTVAGSPTPSKRKHAVDNQSDDDADRYGSVSSKRSFGSHRGIGGEDPEDPIGDFDSSQSQQSSLGVKHSFSKKKARKSKGLEALDFADVHSKDRPSTKAISMSERPSAYSASRKHQKHSLSPHSGTAKKLDFDVHAEASPKWRGLRNDGNTCYLNSSLQALFSVAQFMAAITPSQKGHQLVHTLVRLWKELNDAPSSFPASASARPVKAVIDKLTDRFAGNEQRDAHEFLGEVIDAIHEELVKDDVAKDDDDDVTPMEPTDAFFRIDVEVSLTCKSCGYHRKKQEMYRNLSLDIVRPSSGSGKGRPSVEACLASFFQPEDREIKCEKCEKGEVATQQMKILHKPRALLLHLKRFIVEERPTNNENDPNGAATELIYRKDKAAVSLDVNVSLDNFLGDSCKGKIASSASYALKSVVLHHGNTASSGHYTADGLRDGTWVSFDDGMTGETDLDSIVEMESKQRKAYMLMYSLE